MNANTKIEAQWAAGPQGRPTGVVSIDSAEFKLQVRALGDYSTPYGIAIGFDGVVRPCFIKYGEDVGPYVMLEPLNTSSDKAELLSFVAWLEANQDILQEIHIRRRLVMDDVGGDEMGEYGQRCIKYVTGAKWEEAMESVRACPWVKR